MKVSVPAPGKNYALLIANDLYEADQRWKKLSNPVFDATTLGEDLRNLYGFETEMRSNLKKSEIRDLLLEYQQKTYSDNDELLIFIAGHGAMNEARRRISGGKRFAPR